MTAAAELTVTRRQRNLILVGVLVAMLVAAINQTAVTTVLPTIAADLRGLDLYPWVLTSSLLASAVAVPIFGKLSDLYGRRALYIAGVTIFLLGTVACGLAQSMVQLIGARTIQGIGMGAIMPLAMAIIADVIPASERGKWQGLMGAVFGLATVLGPLAGGSVSDAFGWRWVFWVNVPLAALTLATVVTQLHIPFVRRSARIDWLGAVTLAGSLSLLLLALSEGGRTFAWDSAPILGVLGASAVLLAAFVLAERRAPEPMIPLGLLADRNIALTSIAGFAIGAGFFAAIFYVPLFMQTVVGLSSARSGMALVPLMIGLVVTSTLAGIAVTKTGRYRAVTAAGPLLAAAGLWFMHELGTDPSLLDASWPMLVVGAGIGMTMQNLVLVAQNAVSARDTGVATALTSLVRAVGGTIGIALLGALFASQLLERIAERLRPFGGLDVLAADGQVQSSTILDAADATLALHIREALRLGIADTLLELFLLGIPFMLVAFLAAAFLRSDELSDVGAISVVDELEHEAAGLVPVDADHAPEASALREPARP